MIRNILLSLLVLFAVTQTVCAATESFSERKANLAEFHAIRVGYGLGTVRIVLDLTRKVEFKESYVENPSRMIVDLQNTWLNPTVQRDIELRSTVGKRIRIAQFNPSTVRIVIESMAATKLFFLDGGKSGHRLVIDLGSAEFKEEPELNKTPAQRERELQAERERELQAQRERELERREQAQREKELQEQRERELQAQQKREKELEQRERELERREQAQREKELQEQRERELQAQQQREKELEQRERELERREQAQREKELQEQRERELQAQQKREKELKEKREQEIKEQRERDRERLEQEKREKKERERLEKERREREKKERKERERLEKERREREKKEGKPLEQSRADLDRDREVNQPFTELDRDLDTLTALKGKIIVIDPGHGGNDAGAIGPTGVMEKNVTLRVSLELRKLLEAEGANVILTRYDDSTVSAKGAKASDIEELGARCDVANRAGADIFISIHADSFTRPEARGTTGYYYSKSTTGSGQKLADCIRRNLVEQLGTPSRGTQPCNFYVVKNTDMPATLIELGFISNKEEEKLLDSEDGVKRAAQGIFDGIEDYFG